MLDYFLHVYKRGEKPFRSLSSLPESQAASIMKSLYVEGSIFWERFKDPLGYLTFRKQVEENLLREFMKKGGRPRESCPIYMMVGRPRWTLEAVDAATLATTEEIKVPVDALDPDYISFTYPDSMVSALMAAEKNPEYYEPDYHGKVFTLDEIRRIVNVKGMPGEGWETRMPRHFAHYIEAQVWNREALEEFLRQ